MRLSDNHLRIIAEMEASGYVWLSHLSANGIARFRYKTARGFKGYLKIDGLTFLTKRVATSIDVGSKSEGTSRLTYKEQVKFLEKQLVEVESELYTARGVGKKKMKSRYKEEF